MHQSSGGDSLANLEVRSSARQGTVKGISKMEERIASILKGFEKPQLEVDKEKRLEVIEEDDDWNPEEDDVNGQMAEGGR